VSNISKWLFMTQQYYRYTNNNLAEEDM